MYFLKKNWRKNKAFGGEQTKDFILFTPEPIYLNFLVTVTLLLFCMKSCMKEELYPRHKLTQEKNTTQINI